MWLVILGVAVITIIVLAVKRYIWGMTTGGVRRFFARRQTIKKRKYQ